MTESAQQQAAAPAITIHHCHELAEFEACVELQREVWGFDDLDLIPMRVFVVASKIGGQVIGAYDSDRLIGFALAIPGNRNGNSYLHSHMLAVRDAYRNHGIGRRLKLAQRDDAIERGFDLMEWTFDPLEIKNAYLNLVKLGAITRRYNANQYGTVSSTLQAGLPTDRLVAEWWMKSERVKQVLSGETPKYEIRQTISVPAEIYTWKKSPPDHDKALRVQSANRELFQRAFGQGLAALGYARDAQGNGKFLLGRWDEDWTYASK